MMTETLKRFSRTSVVGILSFALLVFMAFFVTEETVYADYYDGEDEIYLVDFPSFEDRTTYDFLDGDKCPGFDYDKTTNTLTISNVSLPYGALKFYFDDANATLTLNIKGNNTLDYIEGSGNLNIVGQGADQNALSCKWIRLEGQDYMHYVSNDESDLQDHIAYWTDHWTSNLLFNGVTIKDCSIYDYAGDVSFINAKAVLDSDLEVGIWDLHNENGKFYGRFVNGGTLLISNSNVIVKNVEKGWDEIICSKLVLDGERVYAGNNKAEKEVSPNSYKTANYKYLDNVVSDLYIFENETFYQFSNTALTLPKPAAKPTNYTPAQGAINKLVKGKKRITVKYKEVKNASGYQIQCALNKKFKKGLKTATVKQYSSKGMTFKKLKAKKKYYVKVRAYRTVNGKTWYGAWSAVKTVKTK